LDNGFVDVYRKYFPEEKEKNYTYWSYRFQARAKNKGWRLDYFVVSQNMLQHIQEIRVESEQLGSDHVPLVLKIDV
jgi:exodeoxyribonuclease-3